MDIRNKLKREILGSKIINGGWHWYRYHCQNLDKGIEHPFITSLLNALSVCENRKEGMGKNYIQAIADINGREKNNDDYDQLLQILAEIVIVSKVLGYKWDDGTIFEHEPIAGASKKNPEIMIVEPSGFKMLVEVKAPNYIKNRELRLKHETQIPARSEIIKVVDREKTVLPRDNPIKDFLISANNKFSEFIPKDEYFNVLVIVYDDYVQEVVSPIQNEHSGLFTENSFAKGDDGKSLKFENVDIVIITRHLLNICKCLGDQGPVDCYCDALDYGEQFNFTSGIGFPPKVFYRNPFHKVSVPEKVWECFQLVDPKAEGQLPLGAEYIPSDLIFWTKQNKMRS